MKQRWFTLLLACGVVFSGVAAFSAEPQDVLNEARKQVEAKVYAEALQKYESIADWLNSQPDPGLRIEWARVYAYANRPQDAIAMFETIAQANPERAEEFKKELATQRIYLTLNAARKLVDAQAYGDALQKYESIANWLNAQPDPGLRIEWARVYAYANQPQQAIAIFEKAAKANPERAKEFKDELAVQRTYLKLNTARKLVERQDYDAALPLYESMAIWLNAQPDPGLRIEWARAYTYANRSQEAIAMFERIAKANPERAREFAGELEDQRLYLILQRARNLVEQEKYNEAIKVYGEADVLLKRDPGLLIEKARIYSYADRHAEAAQLFEQIRKDYPDYEPKFIRELADMYAWQEDIKKAMETYRQAVKVNPDDIKARLGLARILMWSERYDEAMAEYDAILAAKPDTLKAYIKKAEIYSWRDRLAKAKKLYEHVLTLDPGNIEAMSGLARIMVWQGYHRKGAEQYREVLKLHPDNPDALEGLAFALHWDGRERESLEVVKQLLKVRPTSVHGRRLMYQIYHAEDPYAGVFVRFFEDNGNRNVFSIGLRGGKIATDTTRIEGSFEYLEVRGTTNTSSETRESIRFDRVGLDITQRIGPQLTLRSELYELVSARNNLSVFTTDTSLRWIPVDVLTLKGTYDRDLIYKVSAIDREIVTDTLSWTATLRPDRFWMFSGDLSHSDYSDANEQDAVLGIAEFRLHQEPYIKVYYNFYASEWNRPENEYFSIVRFYSNVLGLYVSKKVTPRLFAEAQCSFGRESHEDFGNVPAEEGDNVFVAAGVAYRPSSRWTVKARVQDFESRPDNAGGFGSYRERIALLSVDYALGGDRRQEQTELHGVIAPPAPQTR